MIAARAAFVIEQGAQPDDGTLDAVPSLRVVA